MAKIYMSTLEKYNTGTAESVSFRNEEQMRELFESDHMVKHTDEAFELWMRVHTDENYATAPDFTVLDTEKKYPAGSVEALGKILWLMKHNLDIMYDQLDEDGTDDRAYKAYWKIGFCAGDNEWASARVDWGATEFECLESALQDIISEY